MTSNNPSDATVSEAMLRAGKHAYLQESFSAIPEADKTLKAIYRAMTSAREQPVGDEGLREALESILFRRGVGDINKLSRTAANEVIFDMERIALEALATPDSKEPTHDQ